MQLAFLGIMFALGAIFGSFVNVVTLRLHTGTSINTPSHCLSCGHRLRARELVPVLSYTLLCGRCAACSARIPPRYVLVELSLGALFVLAALSFSSAFSLSVACALLVALAGVVLYDLDHFIIPDEFIVMLWGIVAASFVGAFSYGAPVSVVVDAGTSAALAASVYAALYMLSHGRWMGFGDVKLAAPLGALLSIGEVFSFVVLSFWVGAVISISIIAVQWLVVRCESYATRSAARPNRYVTMKSEVPFAPFIAAAFLIVYFFHVDVLTLAQLLVS